MRSTATRSVNFLCRDRCAPPSVAIPAVLIIGNDTTPVTLGIEAAIIHGVLLTLAVDRGSFGSGTTKSCRLPSPACSSHCFSSDLFGRESFETQAMR